MPALSPTMEEGTLAKWLVKVGDTVKSGDVIALTGTLGAGKTTFARMLLKRLGVDQPPEGSPSFAIAHEYGASRSKGFDRVVHVDAENRILAVGHDVEALLR